METGGQVPQAAVIPEPGVGSSYGNGWSMLWKFFLELLLIAVTSWIISLPSSIPSLAYGNNVPAGWSFFTFVYNFLVIAPLGYGVMFAYLKASRAEKPEIRDMFEGFRTYWNSVLASLLTAIIIAVGFLLLIIPGIIFACKLSFVPYLVTEWKMDPTTAVKESWRMTSGYAGTVFLIGLLGIPIAIAGIICFGVGIIIASMWISMAIATLYSAVSFKSRAALQRPV